MDFHFDPHVPGEVGDNSVIDHRFEPFRVYHLHMIFDFTPDDFCQGLANYFVSENLLNEFIDKEITGFKNPRLISHEQNEQSTIKLVDRRFFMIDILSNEKDDIKIINFKLYINERVKDILKNYNLRFANLF